MFFHIFLYVYQRACDIMGLWDRMGYIYIYIRRIMGYNGRITIGISMDIMDTRIVQRDTVIINVG